MAIIFNEFDYNIVNQGEIERMFLMPKESTTMSKIMTTLLMPIKKNRFIGREMPYKIWSKKLCEKVSEWYKVYRAHKRNKVYVSIYFYYFGEVMLTQSGMLPFK